MRLSEEVRRDAEALVGRRLGLRLPEERRLEVDRALLEAVHAWGQGSPQACLAWLSSLPEGSPEWGRISVRLTVGETYFFRDPALFAALEEHVLPALIADRRSEGLLRLRLWSAGCATGEEPYSLAMLLDRLLPDRSDWALTVHATDVNPDALAAAERGRYREWSLRETPPWLRERYFHRREDGLELDPEIRRMVTFGPLNLAECGYPSLLTNTTAMDVVLCRNVLMYFDRRVQQECLARLKRALVSGGWLAVSPVEGSAELLQPLQPAELSGSVLYRKGLGRSRQSTVDSRQHDGRLDPQPATPDFLRVEASQGVTLEDTDPPADAPAGSQPSTVGSTVDGLPGRHESPLASARELADQGRLEAARLRCQDALSRDVLDPEAHLLLAAVLQELGDVPAALQALRRVLYLAPDNAAAHFLLGTMLLRDGARDRGRRSFENAFRLLEARPAGEPVEGTGGLTAGRLLEIVRGYLAED